MKIIKIDIENYKKIRAFNCELNGDNLIISGKPDEGKTTAVSALWELIESIQDPLRHGSKNGHVSVTLGEPENQYRIIAERKFTPKTNVITITDSKGKKVSKDTVKELLDKITRDPLKMMELKGLELTKFLLSCVELPGGYDIDALDDQRKIAEQARLDAHRAYGFIKGQFPEEVEKTEKVDVEKLSERIGTIEKLMVEKDAKNLMIRSKEENKASIVNEIEVLKKQIISKQAAYEVIGGYIDEANMERMNTEASLEELNYGSLQELKEQYKNAVDINHKASIYESWVKGQEKVKAAEREYNRLEISVRGIDATKKKALAEAEYPVKGLYIEDGKVLYNGDLLENCGTEKQMLVSASLVASRMKGVKAMRIDRAESMGADARNHLLEICKGLGVQVCMARVTDTTPEKGEVQIVEGVYES